MQKRTLKGVALDFDSQMKIKKDIKLQEMTLLLVFHLVFLEDKTCLSYVKLLAAL